MSDRQGLHQSGLQPRLVRHHALVPRRIKDEIDAHISHGWYYCNFFLSVLHEDLTHAAARRSQSHVDADRSLTVRGRGYITAVDQTEIDNIDGNLGVKTGF